MEDPLAVRTINIRTGDARRLALMEPSPRLLDLTVNFETFSGREMAVLLAGHSQLKSLTLQAVFWPGGELAVALGVLPRGLETLALYTNDAIDAFFGDERDEQAIIEAVRTRPLVELSLSRMRPTNSFEFYRDLGAAIISNRTLRMLELVDMPLDDVAAMHMAPALVGLSNIRLEFGTLRTAAALRRLSESTVLETLEIAYNPELGETDISRDNTTSVLVAIINGAPNLERIYAAESELRAAPFIPTLRGLRSGNLTTFVFGRDPDNSDADRAIQQARLTTAQLAMAGNGVHGDVAGNVLKFLRT